MIDVENQPAAATAVLSIVKLRELHGDLTREYGNFPDKPSREFLEKAAAFQAAASAAGTEISSIDERLEVQSRINFWQSARINAGQRPNTVLLAPFDREAAKLAAGTKAPYKGLAAFQRDDAKIFSGRYDTVSVLVKAVLTKRLLALLGLSGSGKSSVVRAGLIPQLSAGAYDGVNDEDLTDSKGWKYPQPILPGADPLGALEAVYKEITVPADLPAALDREGAPVLLSIDQFEEVFTLSEPGKRRDLFIDALYAAATSGKHRHIVVITMRSEFAERIKKHPAFYEAFEAGTTVIQTMNAVDLRKAIVEPAWRLGVGYEPGLIDKLVNSVEGETAGLPLLSFTLLKLWEMRGDGPMKIADYEALGGNPRVILTRSADAVFESLLIEDQPVVKEIFTRMVKINNTLDATSKRIKRQDLDILGRNDNVDRVLPLLARNNLIRLSPAGEITGATDIEVGHEALIRNWKKLTEWVREGLANETSRKAFAVNAETWAKRTNDKDKQGDLLAGLALREAAQIEDKTPTEIAFVNASQAYETRRERRRWAVTAALAFLLLVALALSYVLFDLRRGDQAKVRSDALLATAETLIDGNELGLAKKLLFGSLENKAELSDRVRALLQAAELNAPGEDKLRIKGDAKPLGASISSDGSVVTSVWSDGVARIWARDPASNKMQVASELRLPNRRIIAAAFSPLGGRVVTASIANEKTTPGAESATPVYLDIWTTDEGGRSGVKSLPIADSEGLLVTSIKFSTKGDRIIVALSDGSFEVTDPETGEMIYGQEGDKIPLNSAVFSSKGDRILVAGEDGWIQIFTAKADDFTFEDAVQASSKPATSARFTESGARFAVGSADGIIRIYQTSDRKKLYELAGHRGGVTGLAFSADGATLVSSSKDGTLRVWELGINAGRSLRSVAINDSAGRAVAVNGVGRATDAEMIVAASNDGIIRILDGNGKKLANQENLGPETDEFGGTTLFVAADRNHVLTYATVTEGRGEARKGAKSLYQLTDLRTGAKTQWQTGGTSSIPADIIDPQLSADGSQMVFTHEIADARARNDTDFAVVTQPTTATAQPVTITTFEDYPLLVALSPDGRTIVTVSDKGRIEAFETGRRNGRPLPMEQSKLYNTGFPIITFSRDGSRRFAIAAPEQSHAYVYDLDTGKISAQIPLTGEATSLGFSPDGKAIFIGSDQGSGVIHDIASGKRRARLDGRHDGSINSVAFSDNGQRLVTTSTDATARIWNVSDGSLHRLLRGHQSTITDASFAPATGNRVLTVSDDGSVIFWDTATGQLLTVMRGPSQSGGIVGWFGRDGRTVRTLSDETTLRTWNVEPTTPYSYDGLRAEACKDKGIVSEDDIKRYDLALESPRLPGCPATD